MRKKYANQHVMNRDGVYYYVRHIPQDLAQHYCVNRLCFSLRTKSLQSANRAAKSVSQRLEDYWLGLRLQRMEIPAMHVLRQDNEVPDDSPILSDACDLYLRLKGSGKDKVFWRTANRNIEYVIKVLGDRPIASYTSAEAAKFRDWLMEQGMGMKTVKRVFATVRAIVNLSISEEGLDCTNAFSKTYFPENGVEAKRQPIPIQSIRSIQRLCRSLDDDMRWLVALISDTGMRLGEAAGLRLTDIKLDAPIPHIDLRPHPWRSLKTRGSRRLIPLVGSSLWAAERLMDTSGDNVMAFPRYCNDRGCNANSASNGLNKWLHQHAPESCVIHSFRHSLRDRLRAVECPSDIVDAIGGWTTAGIGQSYGNGYPLDVLDRWMQRIS
jgi:integrase